MAAAAAQPSWTLDDLLVPHEGIRARLESNPPSRENLLQMMREMHAAWIDESVEMEHVVSWALQRLELPLDGNFTFADFETASLRCKYQYKQLLSIVTENRMFDDDAWSIDAMTAITRAMGAAHRAVESCMMLWNRLEHTRNNRIPPSVTDEETFEDHNSDNLSSFQKLLLYILKRLFLKRLRKCGDSCYQEVVTDEGFRTHTYAFACTIEEEVYDVQKEVSFEMWKHFTNPRDNPEVVKKHLIQSRQAEFPKLDVGCGHWFSYRNGMYNVRHDLFFRYDAEAQWDEYAASMLAARRSLHCFDDEVPGDQYVVPDADVVCMNHFDIEFRNPPTPATAACDVDDYHSIRTPVMERILDAQKLDEDCKMWVYIMLGRLFFRCNEMERWARCFFVVGAGGSGKTSISKWVCHCIPPQFVSFISSNFEEQFGLGPLCDDRFRVSICTELTADIKLKQDEWQICVEGGTLQVAMKNLNSFPYEFKQHMLMTGNQYPKKWVNNAKQISRRAFLIVFGYLVPKHLVDTQLSKKLEEETDMLMRKCTALYVRTALRHPTADLEAPGLMPQQVRDFIKREMETSMDPLASFLDDGILEFDPQFCLPLDEFKREYFEFRRSNGLGIQAWTRDHWSSSFQSRGLGVQFLQNKECANGMRVTGQFVTGARLRDDGYAAPVDV